MFHLPICVYTCSSRGVFVCVYTCTQIFLVLFAKLGADCYSSAPLWTALLVRKKENEGEGEGEDRERIGRG